MLLLLGCGPIGLTPYVAPTAEQTAAAPAIVVAEETAVNDTVEEEEPAVEEEEPAEEEPAEVWDVSAAGPWAVGVTTVTLWDSSRWRSIPVDVWYPVDPAAPDGSDNTYALELFDWTAYEMATDARRDATPADGDWPAVVFSHGYGGIRFQSYFLTEHLASHGFVVISPDHPGNTLSDFYALGSDEAAYQSSVDRPLDVSFALDEVLAGAVPVGIDEARIGITGHSFGGWTAVQAPLDDDRFVASFPMAPGFRETATPDMVAGLGIPFLAFGGSEDSTCEFEENQLAAYEAAGPPRGLVKVNGAGHLDFSNLCEIELARIFVDDGCNEENVDPAYVQAYTKSLATAFAKVWVAGEEDYASFLDDSAVLAVGDVEYWSEW